METIIDITKLAELQDQLEDIKKEVDPLKFQRDVAALDVDFPTEQFELDMLITRRTVAQDEEYEIQMDMETVLNTIMEEEISPILTKLIKDNKMGKKEVKVKVTVEVI